MWPALESVAFADRVAPETLQALQLHKAANLRTLQVLTTSIPGNLADSTQQASAQQALKGAAAALASLQQVHISKLGLAMVHSWLPKDSVLPPAAQESAAGMLLPLLAPLASKVMQLTITNWQLGAGGVEALAAALPNLTHLRLRQGNCKVFDSGAVAAAAGLPKLELLRMATCWLDEVPALHWGAAAVALAESLSKQAAGGRPPLMLEL